MFHTSETLLEFALIFMLFFTFGTAVRNPLRTKTSPHDYTPVSSYYHHSLSSTRHSPNPRKPAVSRVSPIWTPSLRRVKYRRLNDAASNKNKPPHIVFVLADDLGFNDVGFHGSRQVRTPNIDRLAAEGVILDNYYAAPLCSPSRSALLTGRYPIHTGMQHNVLMAMEPYGLGLDETLLPQYLKRYGYATHMIGKWHQGFHMRQYTPTFRGFDSFFGYYCGHKDYFDHTELEGSAWGFDLRDGTEIAYNYTGNYTTDIFTAKAVDVINAHNTSSDQPLFLYIAHLAVHSALPVDPLQTTPERYSRFPHIKHEKRRKFNGVLAALDDSVGQVFAALEARKFTDEVIFVFSSDNGGAADGFDMNFGSNWPLRGMKAGLWEGGVRANGFVWSPRLQKTGYRSHHLMHITDWLPTFVGQAASSSHDSGETTPAYDKVLDGVDMWQTLSENAPQSARDEVVLNIDQVYNIGALRRADGWKILLGGGFESSYDGWYAPESDPNPKSIVSCGPKPNDTRHACRPKLKKPCLFNITEDPCEWRNVAWLHPDVVDELMARMEHYRKSAVPPRNLPADARANPKYHNYVWTWWLEDYGGAEEEQKLRHFTSDKERKVYMDKMLKQLYKLTPSRTSNRTKTDRAARNLFDYDAFGIDSNLRPLIE